MGRTRRVSRCGGASDVVAELELQRIPLTYRPLVRCGRLEIGAAPMASVARVGAQHLLAARDRLSLVATVDPEWWYARVCRSTPEDGVRQVSGVNGTAASSASCVRRSRAFAILTMVRRSSASQYKSTRAGTSGGNNI